MAFASAVNDLSFYMTYENGDIAVNVSQGATSSVVNILFDNDPLDNEFIDLSAYTGVTAVSLSYAYPNDYFLIDDISFNSAAIPEPAGITLFLLGLALAGFSIRQRGSLKY